MSEHQSRVPEGLPTGGQFAATEKPDADVSLAAPPPPRYEALDRAADEWNRDHPRHRLAANEQAVLARADVIEAALAAGEPVPEPDWPEHPAGERTPEQQRYIETMRSRGLASAALEAGALVAAENAVRRYESASRLGIDIRHDDLLEAARALEPHLTGDTRAAVTEARARCQDPGLDAATNARRLHAELVDALEGVPSRATVERYADQVWSARSDETAATTTAERSAAKNRRTKAEAMLAELGQERHDATRTRVARGRPTLYDLTEAQDRQAAALRAVTVATELGDAAALARAQEAHEQAAIEAAEARDAWQQLYGHSS